MRYAAISLLALVMSVAAKADVCDELYARNKARRDKNNNMQLCQNALRGDPDAQFDLAGWYQLEEGNPEEALRWSMKSADQGCAKSQFVAGLMYYYGDGTETDRHKAAELIRSAADNDLPDGMTMLGFMYFHGQSIVQDKQQAKVLYEQVARKQNAIAMNYLGDMYKNGDGVPADNAKSQYYYATGKIAEVVKYSLGYKYPCFSH